jgi:hypothetical protein
MIRVIDNKKIDLTNDEWDLYQQICKSYDVERRGVRGKDLFIDLFETDENGIIIFLKPPQSYTSMEVYMFLVGIMVHQHLGVASSYIDKVAIKLDGKIKEIDSKSIELDEKIEKMESILEKIERKLKRI